MKKIFLQAVLLLALFPVSAFAQKASETKFNFVEASTLTLVGKVYDTPSHPYQRMDFDRYDSWAKGSRNLLEMSSGISVAFHTDSPIVSVKCDFLQLDQRGRSAFETRGFDLYIKKDGKWLWAGDCSFDLKNDPDKVKTLVTGMDGSMHECLLYLPLYSKENSVLIGVKEGSVIEASANPFRHKIVIHGSSFMHGAFTSRAGATVAGFLSRQTGLQFCSLGVSGNCKLQKEYAEALKGAEADAFVFDAFSNPTAEVIEERLFDFIETVQSTHPGVPLIFMQTIYRENRNFNLKIDRYEQAKMDMAEKMMKQACKKYKDVYFIDTNAASSDHETTADGVHPSDFGYHIWADSIREPLLQIFKKYGIY